MNGPLKWHGGKSYIAAWIHECAPPSVLLDPEHGYTHRHIVFGGGLGEFWNWFPYEGVSETVNDLHCELINFYTVLACPDWFAEFQRIVEVTPFGEPFWDAAANGAMTYGLEASKVSPVVARAVAFFVTVRQSRQGLGQCYATPTKRTRRGMNENVSAWLSTIEGLPDIHERLRRVEIRNMDFRDYLDKYDHPRALFYLDPPYVSSTRVVPEAYDFELTERDHEELLTHLATLQGRFMLSGYPSHLYSCWAGDHGYPSFSRLVANHASGRGSKTMMDERLWVNYDPQTGQKL
jgi:DNA adenine methylase